MVIRPRTHSFVFYRSYHIDQCAERVKAIAHKSREMSGFLLYLPLDCRRCFLWWEDTVWAPSNSSKIVVLLVIADFQVQLAAVG